MTDHLAARTGGTAALVAASVRSWRALLGRRPAPPPSMAALDEDAFAALYRSGEIDALDYARCPAEGRTTPHALHADGSRRCWTCPPQTTGDDS